MATATGILCATAAERVESSLGATFPFTGSKDLQEIYASMGDPNIDDDETVLAIAMVWTINQDDSTRAVLTSASNGDWEIPDHSAFLGRDTQANKASKENPGMHAPTLAFIARFNEATDRVKTHLTDLITAQQCKPMTKDNIKSYYASMKIMNIRGSLILRIITPLALLLERIVGKPEIAITVSPWMAYRMSASSTPALCRKTLNIWGTSVPNMFQVGTETAVRAAEDDPSNLTKARAIPKKMVLCAHATLNAFKQLPEDWYYGNTIKESENAMLYKGFYAAAKKLADVGSNTTGIAASTDLTSLVAAIPNTLKNI